LVTSESFAFGPFRLLPTERTLLDNGKPLRLGSRALEILIMLVESAGKIVRKDDMIARVWPGTTVDEASLRVQVAALRKTLGDGRDGNRFITNVPGRGYSFVALATRERMERLAEKPTPAVNGNELPVLLTRVIGRSSVIEAVVDQLNRRRLVTIVGLGGIGKTTIATAVADTVRASYPDGVWFVGLAALASPELVPTALGSVFGIPLPGTNPVLGLTAWLRDKHALIVLDNCEHLVEAVATVVAEILRSASRVSILATSREPLRTEGEWRHRLAPLDFPADASTIAPSDALQYPAVQLFTERALASFGDLVIGNDEIPIVVDICRRLDGVPLALELAAAHVGVLGVRGLAARLDDRFALLIQGRRTALPRHQTLRATLDWSYGLLPQPEQIVLRRLAAFQGEFTMDAARVVAADRQLSADAAVNGVANLVDKSLVTADITGDTTYYHLLEMTRTYGLERLREAGERDEVMRLHASHYRDLFVRAQAGPSVPAKAEWLTGYGRQIGNLRAALEWCFSASGEPALGVSLAAAATDFWIAVSLLSECCDWGSKAVAHLGAAEGTREEMMLQCGLGQALTYTRGMRPEARNAFTRASALSEALEDFHHQLRAIYGLWLFALRVVDFKDCMLQSYKCELLGQATGDPLATATADYTFGTTRYYLAEHAAAAAHLQRARATYPIAMRSGDPIRCGTDLLTATLCYQAVTFWSLGFPEKAYLAGREAIGEARSVDYPVALCVALAAPSSILLVKMGKSDEAERCIDELIDHSGKHSLTPYHAFGLCSKGGLLAARGELTEAEKLLRQGLLRSREVAYYLFDAFFQGELASVLAAAGRIDEGLAEIDAALAYAEKSESLWCMPELLRVKGALLARHTDAGGDAAEEWFVRSRDLARKQEALAWELRSAISLAQLWRTRGRAGAAYTLLDEVYGSFTEGFGYADLLNAKKLMTQLAEAEAR
jgi:predicted ATPase/DNA-binding winged helix-turn-helix (wHTH) protein